MSERRIVVKGTGNVSARPDLTIITMTLNTANPDYKKTMESAGKDIDSIRRALISIGYEREALKTTNFNVRTDYESVPDGRGQYQRKFKDYSCHHSLKLEFGFDMKRLGETLMAISTCKSKPEFHIAFSVKDKDAISAELLKNAVTNATDKATIMSKAAGVKLGAVLLIDYSWGELRLLSETRYALAEEAAEICSTAAVEIEPEDIHETETVTVVWAIE